MRIFLICCFLSIYGLGVTNGVSQSNQNKEEGRYKYQALDSIFSLFDEYRYSNPEKALKLAQKGLEISTSNTYDYGILDSQYRLGLIYYGFGDFDIALTHFDVALKIADQKKAHRSRLKCSNEIGNTYRQIGNYSEALKVLSEGASQAQKLNFEDLYIHHTIGIANVLQTQTYYNKAITYLKPLLNKNLDTHTRATVNNNLGMAYVSLKDNKKALQYYKKSYEHCLDISNNPCELKSLSNMAVIYLEEHKYDEALEHFYKVVAMEEKLGIKQDLIITYNSIGIALRLKKDFEKSIEFIHKSEALAKETKSFLILERIYLSLALAYEDAGKYVKAIDYLYEHRALSDSLFNTKKNEQISKLIVDHETKQKEYQISLLKKDNDMQTALLEKQRIEIEKQKLEEAMTLQKKESDMLKLKNEANQRLLALRKQKQEQALVLEESKEALRKQKLVQNQIIFAVFILSILFGITIYAYRQKLKNKELLALKKEEVQRQRTLKLVYDQEIQNVKNNIEWQEKQKEQISSELHDSVAPSIAAVKLNLIKLSESASSQSDFMKLIQIVDDSYEKVRTVSHNYTSTKLSNGTPFIELLQDYLNGINTSGFLNVSFRCNFKERVNQVSTDIKVEVYRIIQESIQNILKHSKAKSADVQLTWSQDFLNLLVEDNGIGFDVNQKKQGIGLKNIELRVKSLSGVLNIDSLMHRGTIVNIDIPLSA